MTDADERFCGPWHDPHRYRIVGHSAVGRGGEGLVHRAVRATDGLDVAVKLLTATRIDTYPRLAARSASLARVDHPNVMGHAEVFLSAGLTRTDDDLESEDYSVVTSVEHWVDGTRLDDMPTGTGAHEYLRWVAQIARGAHALHHLETEDAPRGIAHRDIKPSNVLITRERVAVLIDLGTAKPINPSADATRGIGTYGWSPPETAIPGEELEQTDDLSVDAWGVGVLAYWAVCGSAPPADLGADERRTRVAHAARAAGLPDPGGLAAHIGRCLSPADRRPRNLNTWADELEALVRPRSVLNSRRVFAGAGALALCGVAVAVIAPQLDLRAAGETPTVSTSIPEVATTVSSSIGSTSTTDGVVTVPPSETDDPSSPNEIAVNPSASSVSFSPDGESVAVSVDDRAEIYDVFWLARNSAGGFGTAPSVRFVGHRGDVNSVAYSPDGTKVVTTSADATARVWDAASGSELLVLSGHAGFVAGPAMFSPDGAKVVTTSSDGTARVWDVQTGAQLLQFGNQGGSLGEALFSPDGRSILVQVEDRAVVYDSTTGSELVRLDGVLPELRRPAFNRDGSTIVTGTDDGRIRMWDTATGELRYDNSGIAAAFSPAGGMFVSIEQHGAMWFMTDEGFAFPSFLDPVKLSPCWDGLRARYGCRAVFSADGSRLFATDGSGELTMWDVPSRSKIATVGEGLALDQILVNSDGSRLLALDEERGALLWTGLGELSSGMSGGSAQVPGCIVAGDVGPSCDEVAAALEAIDVRFATPPFFETDHLFEDGSRGRALGMTMGWTTSDADPFSEFEAPAGWSVSAVVSMTFGISSGSGSGPDERITAFTAKPEGRKIGPFPSSPSETILYEPRAVVSSVERSSSEVIMEIIVCDPTNTECNVTRTLRRAAKPSEVVILHPG